jgi:hypothetical protein
MTRRGLQLFLTVLGAIALVMGVLGVVTGGGGGLDGGHVSPNVDSEIRFFAAWYAGAGVLLLRVRHRVETETTLIRGVCAVLLLAAVGRVFSIIAVGTPNGAFLFLMAVEFAIPAVIVPWQAAVARQLPLPKT